MQKISSPITKEFAVACGGGGGRRAQDCPAILQRPTLPGEQESGHTIGKKLRLVLPEALFRLLFTNLGGGQRRAMGAAI